MSTSPTAMPQRARGSLADLVVNYVKEQVASQALKPGDQLPTETALMSLLGVSRTVVREAISRLQASAVIETRHGIGSFVLEPRHQPRNGMCGPRRAARKRAGHREHPRRSRRH
jgi:GntR family transcriptional regulator, transcriptional repressor for pyruvate dehydrogenase complex